MPASWIKDPQAVLDYQIDWSAWLGTDTISTSTWTVPTGLTKVSDTKTTTTTTILLSGGTVGESYSLVNHIVTAALRQDDRTLTFEVKQR